MQPPHEEDGRPEDQAAEAFGTGHQRPAEVAHTTQHTGDGGDMGPKGHHGEKTARRVSGFGRFSVEQRGF